MESDPFSVTPGHEQCDGSEKREGDSVPASLVVRVCRRFSEALSALRQIPRSRRANRGMTRREIKDFLRRLDGA